MIRLISSASLCLRSFRMDPLSAAQRLCGLRCHLSEPRGFSLYRGANHCNFAGW